MMLCALRRSLQSLLVTALVLLMLQHAVHAAIECDGVDDVLTAAALSTYMTAAASTYMVWYTSSGPQATGTDCAGSTSQAILGSDNGSFQWIYITWKDSNELCGGHREAAAYDHVSIPYAGSGTTSHVAVTHGGGNINVYHNGVLIGTLASGDTETITNPVRVCDGRGLPAAGIVHHAVLYDVVVPAAEIAVLALSKTPRLRKSIPTAEWLFDNCAESATGNTIAFRDHSFNGRTITGAHGANASGMTCRGSRLLMRPGGIQ